MGSPFVLLPVYFRMQKSKRKTKSKKVKPEPVILPPEPPVLEKKKFDFGVGRPPVYNTPEEMQAKIIEYFEGGHNTRQVIVKIGSNNIPITVPKITITDLVLFLGFADRSSFYDYEKKEEFFHTIKRARTFIEREYEEQLDRNPTGAIFALKNFGWSDKQTIEHEGGIETTPANDDTLLAILLELKALKDDKQAETTGSSEENNPDLLQE